MRFGIQMFGLNPMFQKDPDSFLAHAKSIGFRYLEPVLSLTDIPGLSEHIWLPEQLAIYQPLLKQYGLQIFSCHVFTANLRKDAPAILEIAASQGISQVVLPCPYCENPEDYKETAQMLKETASLFAACGIELLLHNDRKESHQKLWIDGEEICGFEYLLSLCGDSVSSQADVGWLLYGGVDPEAFLWRNEKKIRSLHYKDMKSTDQGLAETGIGQGLLDMTACFQFARATELIQYVDQDQYPENYREGLEPAAEALRKLQDVRANSRSTLCIMDIKTGEIQKLKTYDYVIEAPNWYQQNDDILFYNAHGHIYRYQISTGEEAMIDTGMCDNCNNDHVLSAHGDAIAVSHSARGWESRVYIIPFDGGEIREITPNAPSFLHGWSPDTKELSYCAFRMVDGQFQVDVYSISAEGGEEKQLTCNAGFNDGPEYSPDGSKIWFISTRSGLMQVFTMNRDGSNQQQMTWSDRNNWFGHISPDNQKVVYLSYSKEGLDPEQHLPNMQVQLRLMNADGSDDHTILEFFGGQGSINVNSWNPDSRRFAFVTYELLHK